MRLESNPRWYSTPCLKLFLELKLTNHIYSQSSEIRNFLDTWRYRDCSIRSRLSFRLPISTRFDLIYRALTKIGPISRKYTFPRKRKWSTITKSSKWLCSTKWNLAESMKSAVKSHKIEPTTSSRTTSNLNKKIKYSSQNTLTKDMKKSLPLLYYQLTQLTTLNTTPQQTYIN